MRTAAVPNESCHFWSIRSRITWQLIGGGIFAAFAALGIEALVNEARNHQSEAPALVSVSVCMVIAVFIFANAFRTGHLWLTRDRLTYQAVFRSNHFSRQEISGARIEVRT